MPCYRPNIIYVQHAPNEEKARILKYINSRSKEFPGYEFFEKENQLGEQIGSYNEYIQVPCGDCIGCQEQYSKQWAVRCMLEAQAYKENYFITLTYNDEHLPMESELVDPRTGEVFKDPGDWLTGHLVPEHLTKFFKDLRSYWEYHYKHTGIRFFACGEYGGQTQRPHYHAVIFNLPLKPEDLKVYKVQPDGTVLYTSHTIEKIWGKGFITIAEVNWDTCAYTARYVMKKMKGHKSREEYFSNGQIPEFIRMSRQPGIASDYFDQHAKDIFENDEIIIKGHKEKIQPVKPPKYYDRKYDIIYHGTMNKIKEERKRIAKINLKARMTQTSKTIKEQLLTEESYKKDKWKSLQRNKV